MPYAQVTLAISDQCPGGLEGFAPLSDPLPASVFADAVEDGQAMDQSGATFSIFVDLMDEHETQVGEKCISLSQAAAILDLPPETLVALGRQRLARLDDEAAAYVAGRTPERVGKLARSHQQTVSPGPGGTPFMINDLNPKGKES